LGLRVPILGRQLPLWLVYVASFVLAVSALACFALALLFDPDDTAILGPLHPDHIVTHALPGLIPAFIAWGLLTHARQVVFDAAAAPPMKCEGTSAPRATGRGLAWIMGGILAVAAILQGGVVVLLVVSQMSHQQVFHVGGWMFLAAALLPAGFGGWLAWRITRDAQHSSTDSGLPLVARPAGGTQLVLGVASAILGLATSGAFTFGYLMGCWYSVDFNVLGVLMVLAPAILCGGLAIRLLDLYPIGGDVSRES